MNEMNDDFLKKALAEAELPFDPDCLFCKIIKGEIPSSKIYEDRYTYAFLDISPVNEGHTLVIPKEHYENIFDVPEETLMNVSATVKKVAKAVKEAVLCDGINIMQNNLAPAGQVVNHLHFHIIPRLEGDGLELWHGESYPEGKIESIKQQIIDSLNQEY